MHPKNRSGGLQGSIWVWFGGLLAAHGTLSGMSWAPFRGSLGRAWAPVGRLLGQDGLQKAFGVDSGSILGRFGEGLGGPWGAPGESWGALGAFLGALGAPQELPRAQLGEFSAWEGFGKVSGAFGEDLGKLLCDVVGLSCIFPQEFLSISAGTPALPRYASRSVTIYVGVP